MPQNLTDIRDRIRSELLIRRDSLSLERRRSSGRRTNRVMRKSGSPLSPSTQSDVLKTITFSAFAVPPNATRSPRREQRPIERRTAL
ncbi:hypothetical protein B1812_00905 [Methylocystis bryophila]|uniref:Uncharacterized protein n=1 Tax=Methylocystis bryophila TaxID=655015 RepID=A0A1W6MQP8_9HYPH|nr:hypothetical protein B1812_00905 [Methylocystis bryophila]